MGQPVLQSFFTMTMIGDHSGVVRSHLDRGSKQSPRVNSTDSKSRSSGTHTGPTKSRTTPHARGRGSDLTRSRFSGTHTGPAKSRTTRFKTMMFTTRSVAALLLLVGLLPTLTVSSDNCDDCEQVLQEGSVWQWVSFGDDALLKNLNSETNIYYCTSCYNNLKSPMKRKFTQRKPRTRLLERFEREIDRASRSTGYDADQLERE